MSVSLPFVRSSSFSVSHCTEGTNLDHSCRQRAGVFARKIARLGVQHQVTDADIPWQNDRVERHDQWIQSLMKSLETRFVESDSELEVVAFELVSQKNR